MAAAFDVRTDAMRAETGRAQRGRSDAAVAVIRAPWTPTTWLATTHVIVGALLGLVTFGVLMVLGFFTAGLAVLPFSWVFARLQRVRFAAYLAVSIELPAGHAKGQPWIRWLWRELRAAHTWRQLGYNLVAGVLGVFGAAAVLACWSGGLLLSTVFAHARFVTPDGLLGLDLDSRTTLGVLTGVGVLLLYLAPWIARGVAGLDLAVARTLLDASDREELTRRVETLTASRADVVAAADAERRRIERDLHDGTQQRLVSLAVNLGIVRALHADVPAPARDAIALAHEEAKAALAELRDFIRGLHPVVLDDRGLDAALSGVAARSPIPVRLRVRMLKRPSLTTEAIAYFVVSEALANAAKHSRATRVDVVIDQPDPGRLRVAVTDDGVGGALVDRGTGLRGLARRAGSVDGTFSLDSPPGGPTRIVVELPCEL
jgi:signal transduction histidine kinase